MKTVGLVIRVVCAGMLAGGQLWGAVIANYQGDYLTGTSNGQTRRDRQNDGWDYMWNSGGQIGVAGNYSSLKWWSSGNHYNFDGAGDIPRAEPAAWVLVNSTGGHPGRGSTQNYGGSGNTIDRYAIAAYTLQPGEGGLVQIAGSSIHVPSASSNGVEVRVYVNDTLMSRFVRPGGGVASSFNQVLGFLNPTTDTVYVAVGPNTADTSDSFGLAYRLETVTDSSVVIWDADGSLPINGGTGAWDTTSAHWVNYTGAYAAWNNTGNWNANFLASGGTVTLSAPITARSLTFSAGGYTIAGTSTLNLTASGSGGPGPQTISVVSDTDTAVISAPISGSSLNKIDMGTLRLEGTTTVSNLRAAGGNLVLAGSSVTTVNSTVSVGVSPNTVAGGSSGTLTIQDSAQLNATYIYMGENINSQISGMVCVINQTGGTVTTTGVDDEGNGIRVGHWPNETSIYNLSGGTLTLNNNAELALAIDGTGIFNQSGGTLNVAKLVVNARNNANGNGTYNLTGGTANIGAGGIVNEGTGPAAVNLGGAGPTLRAAANWASSLNMTLSGTGANAVRIDTNGYSITLSGVLSGAGGLRKVGNGDLVLTGANTYQGGTTVLAGRLLVNNTTGSGTGTGAVVVQGGLLGGNGIIGGNVLVQAGGTVSAGNSPGKLTIQGNYTQQDGGTLLVELAGYTQGGTQALPGQWTTNGYDWVSVGGQAVLDGYVQIALLAGFQPASGDKFNVLTAAGGITDQGLDLIWQSGSLLPAQYWTYRILSTGQGNEQILQLQLGVPEPASLVLLVLGAAGLFGVRRLFVRHRNAVCSRNTGC